VPYVVLRVHLRESGGKKEERKREREREKERERERERERGRKKGGERERERGTEGAYSSRLMVTPVVPESKMT